MNTSINQLPRRKSWAAAQSAWAGLLLAAVVLCPSAAAQQRDCITVNCPNAVEAEVQSTAGAVVDFNVTVASTCGPVTSLVCTPPSGSKFPLGTTQVKCVARNLNDGRGECTFPVIVRDTTGPVISVQAPPVVRCATRAGVVYEFVAKAFDISQPVTLTCNPPNKALLPVGTNLITCIAADALGNRSTNRFSVIVTAECSDCVDPVCPTEPIVVDGDAEGKAIVNFPAQTTSACGGEVWLRYNPPSGSAFPVGTNTVACTAGIGDSLLQRCEFQVVVRDTSPPVITVHAPPVVQCASATGTVFNYVAQALDPSQPVTLECFPPSGSVLPIGTNQITCVATDAVGNSSTNYFPVIVTSACAECVELICPPSPILADANDQGVAIVNYAATAINHCGGNVWLNFNPEPGSAFPVGTNTVIVTAGVGTPILQQCEIQVVVRDVTPPTVQTGNGLNIGCQRIDVLGPGANVPFNLIKARDNADPAPKVVFSPPSGSFFHVGTHDITCTATDASGNQAIVHFPLTVFSGPKCEISVDPDVAQIPDNWDFELGLTSWIAQGNAFEEQPTLGDNVAVYRITELKEQIESKIGGDYWRNLSYPIGHHAKHWIGTAEYHADDSTEIGTMRDESAVGTLVSKLFKPSERCLWLLIGGNLDHDRLRVELLLQIPSEEANAVKVGSSWYRIVKYLTGHDDERLRRDYFNVENYMDKLCRIRIVDRSPAGHINVDDFRFQPSPPVATEVATGGILHPAAIFRDNHVYDWDAPIWGLADLHTHPIAHLGLGQHVFHGKPDGVLSQALDNCNCDHGGHGLDNGCGNYLRQLVLAAFDGESPADPHQLGWDSNQWARFRKWPVFTSFSHQQMWFEWIRRAYDGGLRVMVALTVHNRFLAGATVDSIKPYDDASVLEAQVKELKAFVARHSDFMEIAYDPIQLRSIVRENKLAIIIGSETDDIGNFDENPDVDQAGSELAKKLVKKEIEHLYYDLGMRYIFPVHLTDNKFGGSAIYNPLFAMATKKYIGTPTHVEPAGDGIVYRVPSLDATGLLPDAGTIFGSLAEAVFNPFAPLKLILETQSMIAGQDTSFSDSSFGMAGVGVMATLPLITAGAAVAAPALIEFFGDVASLDLPSDILPIGGNYPDYSKITDKNKKGHRNVRGLSTLGKYAIGEMMRLGMIVDIDHSSDKSVENALDLSEQVPGGYPMNSGHNSFRDLRRDANENNRTIKQLRRIQASGGMMGLGWGNGDYRAVSEGLFRAPTNTVSYVENNSPGSSKTFAQSALFALEFMKPRQVAIGSDINGFVVGPGPRFGPQSAFGMREDEDVLFKRSQYIKDQGNGIAYSPREGRPGASGVFQGRAVDPDKNDENARKSKGYAYNQQQRDFFVALRIFRWGFQRNPRLTHDEVQVITDNLHDTYDRNRVKEFARGLLIGPNNGDPGKDIDGDVETKQKLAKAVYRKRVLHENPPSEISGDETKNRRYHHFLDVWDDYEKIYGDNAPMKRCETHLVQWDYNFDGLAHYGMLPDFFQDLKNVDLKPADMSGLFQSADGFAQMWTRCVEAAWEINNPDLFVEVPPGDSGGPGPGHKKPLKFDWAGNEKDVIEESEDLSNPQGWRPALVTRHTGDIRQSAELDSDPNAKARFFRIRKVD